jgi:hypothetical protein
MPRPPASGVSAIFAVSNIVKFNRKEHKEHKDFHRSKERKRKKRDRPFNRRYGRTLKTYMRQVEKYRVRAFTIEKILHKNPRQFRNAWGKIRRKASTR